MRELLFYSDSQTKALISWEQILTNTVNVNKNHLGFNNLVAIYLVTILKILNRRVTRLFYNRDKTDFLVIYEKDWNR